MNQNLVLENAKNKLGVYNSFNVLIFTSIYSVIFYLFINLFAKHKWGISYIFISIVAGLILGVYVSYLQVKNSKKKIDSYFVYLNEMLNGFEYFIPTFLRRGKILSLQHSIVVKNKVLLLYIIKTNLLTNEIIDLEGINISEQEIIHSKHEINEDLFSILFKYKNEEFKVSIIYNEETVKYLKNNFNL